MTTNLQAQQTEQQLVESTLNCYMEGLLENDANKLKISFHKTATMRWFIDGYKEVNAAEALISSLARFPRKNMKTNIISVNISGNAANAHLELIGEDVVYIDFMNLLKIDGTWKIVNKIFNKK